MAMKRMGKLLSLAFLLSFTAQVWLGSQAIPSGRSVAIAKRSFAEPGFSPHGVEGPGRDVSTFVNPRGEVLSVRTVSQGCSAIVGDVVHRLLNEFSARVACAESLFFTIDPTREPLGRAPPSPTFSL